jgi:thioredoxin 2
MTTTPTRHIVCIHCAAVNRVPTDKQLHEGQCGACKSPLASDTPVDISDKVLDRLLARDEGAFVLDVWAPWCGPCPMLAPDYEAAAAHYQGKLRFLKLNSEDNPDSAARLRIRGIPSLFIFRQGQQLDHKSGAMQATMLVQWIDGVHAGMSTA